MTFSTPGAPDGEFYCEAMRVDDPERCPWCGQDCDDPTVGRGDVVNITRYNEWLEDHVLDCKPYQKEAAEDA